MHSFIYEGHIRHRRFQPVENAFKYRLFMMYLDLSELPMLFDRYWFWSYERWNLACLKRKDYWGDSSISLDEAVRDLVKQRLGIRPDGPIRMLTHLRYFGYCFNPVSFYYCFDSSGSEVKTIVAEIHNTPWNERYCYVLGDEFNVRTKPAWKRYRFTKSFHVSPFIDMGIDYEWIFRAPDRRIHIHMVDFHQGNKLFDATLTLKRHDLSGKGLARVLVHYPFMTMKVMSMIYWQALRLWWKKVPFYSHPKYRIIG